MRNPTESGREVMILQICLVFHRTLKSVAITLNWGVEIS